MYYTYGPQQDPGPLVYLKCKITLSLYYLYTCLSSSPILNVIRYISLSLTNLLLFLDKFILQFFSRDTLLS